MRQLGGCSELLNVPPSTEDLRDSRCGSNLSLLEEGANSLHYSNPTLLASPAVGGGRGGHQQTQDQVGLAETRFNGSPQQSPCKFFPYVVTVWKIQDFSVTQILREINFVECKS